MTPDEAIAFMKKNKVLHLKLADGLELHLAVDAFREEPATPVVDEKEDPTLDERGSSGMTRREQIELLGGVYEADFRKRA